MDPNDYFYKRFLIYSSYFEDNVGALKETYDEAYCKGDIKLMRALNKELNVEINGYSYDMRREINELFSRELGEELDSEKEVKRLKKLAAIRKRGYIKNRDESELVHSRVDELSDQIEENPSVGEEMDLLDEMMLNCSPDID